MEIIWKIILGNAKLFPDKGGPQNGSNYLYCTEYKLVTASLLKQNCSAYNSLKLFHSHLSVKPFDHQQNTCCNCFMQMGMCDNHEPIIKKQFSTKRFLLTPSFSDMILRERMRLIQKLAFLVHCWSSAVFWYMKAVRQLESPLVPLDNHSI